MGTKYRSRKGEDDYETSKQNDTENKKSEVCGMTKDQMIEMMEIANQ